jgi:hypothetical protein
MNDYSKNYNVRDEKGRFVTTSTTAPRSTTVSTTPCPSTLVIDKEMILEKLRKNVYVTKFEDANGNICTRNLTLHPSYLSGYVGKGTSKSAPTNKVYAYDVDGRYFVGFQIEKVKNMDVAPF